MKHVLASTLFAGLLALGACAHSDEMAMPAPSTLTADEIKAELASIAAESSSLWQRRPYSSDAPTYLPVTVVGAVDSKGVPLQAYNPGPTPSLPASHGSSRPWGYGRLEALGKRSAALLAELRQRGVSRP